MQHEWKALIMDVYSSKRGVAMTRAPRKEYNIGSRNAKSSQDQNVQHCNRVGCNGRIKYGNQNAKTGSSEKAKSSQSSFCSLNGNGVIETPSRSGSVMAREKSSYIDSKRTLSSQLGFDQSESSQSVDSEAVQSMVSPVSFPTSYHSELTSKPRQVPFVKTVRVPLFVRSREKIQFTSESNKKNTRTTSACSSTSKSSVLGTLNSSDRSRGRKNPKCNSMSDATPPSCSSSRSKSPSKNVIKKRSLEEDSCVSGRGRQTTTTATFGGRVSSLTGGASTSDYRRNGCTSVADSSVSASVRTGGSTNVNKSRMKLPCQQNGKNTSCYRESSTLISQNPDSESPKNVGRSRLLPCQSVNVSASSSSSYSLFSSNDENHSTSMPISSTEHSTLQQYNMNGFAEVLLALERIELEEEMVNEQILSLENILYRSGLILYDQHQDMRLDIDGMSYEELLALGDRIGTVSTALSEEELLKCVKRSMYQATMPEVGFTKSGEDGDNVKCSICQENYIMGDEIGELVECEHAFHGGCIDQWLRLKNWCPICKTGATPPRPSTTS